MPRFRFLVRFPLRVMDLEVLGTHQLPRIVFWVSGLVKNLSFAQKPPATAALKKFFCAREGTWTQAKANKLVISSHWGWVSLFSALLWAVWTPYSRKCFHVQPLTFKRVSVAEQKNFCSCLQTSLPTEAALSSASHVLLLWVFFLSVAAGRGFMGFLQPHPHEAARDRSERCCRRGKCEHG